MSFQGAGLKHSLHCLDDKPDRMAQDKQKYVLSYKSKGQIDSRRISLQTSEIRISIWNRWVMVCTSLRFVNKIITAAKYLSHSNVGYEKTRDFL